MITDNELIEITKEIDRFNIDMLVKYNIEPLNLTGIVLARLIHLNKNSNEFYKLMGSVLNKEHEKPERRTIQ
jgi:hypothetical protein